MAVHSNFSIRSNEDAAAANIAVAAVLKSLFSSDIQNNLERVHQLIDSACDGDVDTKARAMWFAQWMAGQYSADGDRP